MTAENINSEETIHIRPHIRKIITYMLAFLLVFARATIFSEMGV